MLLAALALSPALLPDAVAHTASGRPLRPASRPSRAEQISVIFSRSLYDGVKVRTLPRGRAARLLMHDVSAPTCSQVEDCLFEAEASAQALDCLLPPAKPPASDRSGQLNPALSAEEKRLHLLSTADDLDECIVNAESAAERSECEADAALLASGAGAAASAYLAESVRFASWLYAVPSLIEEIPIRLAATTRTDSLSLASCLQHTPALIEDIPCVHTGMAQPMEEVPLGPVELSVSREDEAKRAWLARQDQEPSWRKPRAAQTEPISLELADVAPPIEEAEPSPNMLSTAAEEAKRAWLARHGQEPSWRKSRAVETERIPAEMADLAPPTEEVEPSPILLSVAAEEEAEEEAEDEAKAIELVPGVSSAETEPVPVELAEIAPPEDEVELTPVMLTPPTDEVEPIPVVLAATAEAPPSFIYTPDFPALEGPILITKGSKFGHESAPAAAATPSLIFSLKPISRRSTALVKAKVEEPPTDSGFWSTDLTIAVALTVAKARLGAARGAGGLGSVRSRARMGVRA
jgi:hypothetical protein